MIEKRLPSIKSTLVLNAVISNCFNIFQTIKRNKTNERNREQQQNV